MESFNSTHELLIESGHSKKSQEPERRQHKLVLLSIPVGVCFLVLVYFAILGFKCSIPTEANVDFEPAIPANSTLPDTSPPPSQALPSAVNLKPLVFAKPGKSRNQTSTENEYSIPGIPFPPSPPILVSLKVSAVVFYGRRRTISILNSYLERNLVDNGGMLHNVYFVSNTEDKEDLKFLDILLARQPKAYIPINVGHNASDQMNFNGHYSWMPRDQLFVKIDDDVIFIQDGAIEALIEEKLKNRFLFVSANVVNHPLLTVLHQQLGAMVHYKRKGDTHEWTRESNQTLLHRFYGSSVCYSEAGTAKPGFGKSWDKWECATQVHENFLYNVQHHMLNKYMFSAWDFHAHDNYMRWSINMIAMNSNDVLGKITSRDDEERIAVEIPKERNWHCGAAGKAIAVHYAYFPQRKGLNSETDIIDKYRSLAKTICGSVLDEDGQMW